MKIEELKEEEMYCLCAPDGSTQLMTLAPDFQSCAAVIKLLETHKIGQSPSKLFQKGFEIMPVKVTITQNGDANSGYQDSIIKLINSR